MSIWRLVLRSIIHDRRSLSGTLFGTVLAAMVLVGALIVGDSVRHTLRNAAIQRIGAIDLVMNTGGRFVRSALADELSAAAPEMHFAPVLRLQGMASTVDRSRRALNVFVSGVDERFFSMAPRPQDAPALKPGEALVNERLAVQLALQAGDTFVMRVNRPSALSRDLTFAATDDSVLALRLTVAGIVSDDHFGRFSLTADQTPPFNVFVSLEWLAQSAEQPGRANLLLVDHDSVAGAATDLDALVAANWRIEDLGLEQRGSEPDNSVEWRTDRVFLDAAVVRAAAEIEPRSVGVLTYFVNEIRCVERSTPYSTVTGIGPLAPGTPLAPPWNSIVPDALAEDEIVITQWLAEDLDATIGDAIELRYFILGAGRRLTEQSAAFTVYSIIDATGPAADPRLMPDIRGLSDSADCRDWNPGIPVDLERIRDKDEAYWDEHRGAPKALISLAAAQKLWANRFGDLTAIRTPTDERTALAPEALLANLLPATFGFSFTDMRGSALAAANPTTDFGGLFIGLSLFLIVSAALLAGMLFAFTVNRRMRQVGTLLAVGWTQGAVRGWLAREALLIAAIGSVVGAALGVAYSALLLRALSTIWQGAVASAPLTLFISPVSIALGALLALIAAMTAMHFAVRSLLAQTTLRLLAGESAGRDATARRGGRLLPACTAMAFIGAIIGLILGAAGDRSSAIAAFFTGGALLLTAGILSSRLALTRFVTEQPDEVFTVTRLALRSAARRPGRTTTSIALLACGCFLVVAVGMNRLAPPEPGRRDSGTGGFALVAQSSIPLLADLNEPATRETLNLDAELFEGVSFVPLRVRGGDEASCLNLNRAQQPRILGVSPSELAARDAFRFAAMYQSDRITNPWMALNRYAPDGFSPPPEIIPAIVDQASMMWAMHRRLGDIIWYENDRGEDVGLQLVGALSNSILQGSLIISEEDFEHQFSSQAGHGLVLIDAPIDRAAEVGAALTRSLEDIGLEVVPTAQRLAEFNAVQNTYLAVFQVLGGLGLIIGTAGLAMVLLRNVSDRRGELALLIAMGFTQAALRRLLLIEHGLILALGVACGVLAAVPAVWPSIRQSASTATIATTLLIIALVAAFGMLWVILATRLATRGRLIDALRYE